MLQFLHDHFKGVLAWGIVVMLVVPFALWGINQYSSVIADNYVAKVNGQEITPNDFRTAYQNRYEQMRRLFGKAFKPGMIDENSLKQHVLDQLINEALLSQQAHKTGYRVSNQELAQAVQKIGAFQAGGKFSPALYQSILAQQGITVMGFEARYRQQLELQQFITALTDSALATHMQLDRRYALSQQKRKLSWLTVTASSFLKDVKVTDAEIKTYFQAHKQEFMTPETVSLAYLELNDSKLAQNIKVDDTALRNEYEQRQQSFMAAAERKARHILISVKGKGAKADSAAKQKAEEVLKKLKAGADFSNLAQKYSDDSGSAKQGGELGWIQRGEMVKPFEDALFAMKKGEISGLIKTQYGYHIIQLEDIRAPHVEPFEKVKDKLAAEYRKKKADDEYYKLTDQLQNLTYEHDESLQAAAKALHIPILEVSGVTRNAGSGIASNSKVREAAFSDTVLVQGLNSDPIEIGPNHVVIIRVREHEPSRQRPLSDVRDRIKDALKQQDASRQAAAKAAGLVMEINKGNSIEAIAKLNGLDFKPARFITRNTSGVPSALVTAAFKAPIPENKKAVVRAIPVANGDQAVFALDEVKLGDPSSVPKAQRKALLQQLAKINGNEELEAYISNLRAHAEISIKKENMQ